MDTRRTRRQPLHAQASDPSASALAEPVGSPLEQRILVMRGRRVMRDADLAQLYGVPAKRLNEQVKRNRRRFPCPDFMFQLTDQEVAILKSHFQAVSQFAEFVLPCVRSLIVPVEGVQMAYMYGQRHQLQLLPACIEDYVPPEDPVRAYDAFVE